MNKKASIAFLCAAGSGLALFCLSTNFNETVNIRKPKNVLSPKTATGDQLIKGEPANTRLGSDSPEIPQQPTPSQAHVSQRPLKLAEPVEYVEESLPKLGNSGQAMATISKGLPIHTADDLYRIYRAIDQAIDSGMQLPAVYHGQSLFEELSGQQQIALGAIEREFIEAIQPIVDPTNETDRSASSPEEMWNQAQSYADLRYKLLFGDEAYNASLIQSAMQALGGD